MLTLLALKSACPLSGPLFITQTLEKILAGRADAALIVNEWGMVLCATREACQLLKYEAGELNGQMVELLIPDRHRLTHIGHRLRFTDDRRLRPMGAGLKLFALCKDGSEIPADVSLNPLQLGLENLNIVTIQVRE